MRVVLSTQAMLGTLMTTNEGTDAFSTSTAAATIHWILKDGLGQAGGIAFVALLGSKLDSQAKMLRFQSSVLLAVGSALDFALPWFTSEWGMGAFLPVASLANVAINVSWMLASATRAHFMRQCAFKDNLGDLTGKATSQMTLSTLVGTVLGLAVLKAGSWPITLGSWSLAAAATLFTGFRSCKSAFSRQLNPNRLAVLAKTGMATPEVFNAQESFLLPARNSSSLRFNVPLIEVPLKEMQWISPLTELSTKHFAVSRFEKKIYIWTTGAADSQARLEALLTAVDEKGGVLSIAGLKEAGWDTGNFSFPPLEDEQRVLYLKNQ